MPNDTEPLVKPGSAVFIEEMNLLNANIEPTEATRPIAEKVMLRLKPLGEQERKLNISSNNANSAATATQTTVIAK